MKHYWEIRKYPQNENIRAIQNVMKEGNSEKILILNKNIKKSLRFVCKIYNFGH